MGRGIDINHDSIRDTVYSIDQNLPNTTLFCIVDIVTFALVIFYFR